MRLTVRFSGNLGRNFLGKLPAALNPKYFLKSGSSAVFSESAYYPSSTNTKAHAGNKVAP